MVVSRRERDRRPWSLGGLALASCFDTPDPPWLLDESVEIIAVRAEVIEDGPASLDLGPVPADRRRAEAIPGDVVRTTVLAASLDGIADPADMDAAFFLCRGVDCVNDLRDDEMFAECRDTLGPGEGCALGRGAEMTFTMQPVLVGTDFGDFGSSFIPGVLASLNVGVVMGTPNGPDTSECIERLRQRPYPSLSGCSLFHHWVPGGPYWKLAELTDMPINGIEPPPQLRYLPPNFNPEIERFSVVIRSATDSRSLIVPRGERVAVQAGERVELAVEVDARDLQSYLVVYAERVGGAGELPIFAWYADTAVSTVTESWREPAVTWTVPDDVPAVSFVATMEDGIGGVGWGTIAFDVAGVRP